MSGLRIVVEQTAPVHLDADANARVTREAAERARDEGAHLVVFPELSLTGYDLGRWARELAVPAGGPDLGLPADGPAVVVGAPQADPDGRLYNAGLVLRGSRVVHRRRKRYLPTYGMFDEGRVFAPGEGGPRLFEPAPGWPSSLLVCEELWHPALPWLAALRGADLLVVISAGPGRVLREDGPRGPFESSDTWELLARAAAVNHGLYLVLCNRAGVEGGVTFAGGSLVVDPRGRVVARAGVDPERLVVELDHGEVERARTPFSHLRDEDPQLVRRELEGLLAPEDRG